MNLTINGQRSEYPDGLTLSELLVRLELQSDRVAVELNQTVTEHATFPSIRLHDHDTVEIITFVGGGGAPVDTLNIGGTVLSSRLIIGTGKYKDFAQTKAVVEASGAEVVTVAVRRVNILDRTQENLLDYLDPKIWKILPNTAGCYTVDEAVRTARLARASGISEMVKLEVIGDPKTLFPDTAALLEAAKILVREGFIVLPYTNDDPVVAKRLEDAGCAAVMPLAAPIGSGLGVRNPYNLMIVREAVKIPVIVDAGVGTASDAAIAMELGADGVLMNTGIAGANDPMMMAVAMRHAVTAGRMAYLAGRMPRRLYAAASSPLEGLIE